MFCIVQLLWCVAGLRGSEGAVGGVGADGGGDVR